MKDNLSKGHLSEAHQESHVRKINSSTAQERINNAVNDAKKKNYGNMPVYYGSYNTNRPMSRGTRNAITFIDPPRTVNELYNTKHTMSPFAKRNGKRAKLIRPYTAFVGMMKQRGKQVRRKVIQSIVNSFNRKNFSLVIVQPNVSFGSSNKPK
jgi:hypothetical protein